VNYLVTVALALFAGLMVTRIFKYLHLNFPDVTAFLIAGLLVGPYGLGRLGISGLGFPDYESIEDLKIIENVALGFIAFSIGEEFKLEDLKKNGKSEFFVGCMQAVITTVVVDLLLGILHIIVGESVLPMSAVITLGSIAAATAPAATLMVIRQYKADGPLTRLLMPVVALDDAVGLILFSVSFGIATAMKGGTISIFTVFVDPLIEIVASLGLGALMGLIMSGLERLFYSNSNRLAMTISFVFLTVAISSMSFSVGPVTVSFSSLLVLMMTGTVFCNMDEFAMDIFQRCDRWTVPLYCVFFVISGAELDLGVFMNKVMLLVGIVCVLSRMIGKYVGAWISTTIMKEPPQVRKYLGVTLWPQAGVALGMILVTESLGGYEYELIRNVVLLSVLIYELFGPTFTMLSLRAAGEITVKPKEKSSRRRFGRTAAGKN
jgi:Kef-type K+ transport system membrane component KefB